MNAETHKPAEADLPSDRKPVLTALSCHTDPDGLGKYLVKRRDGTVVEWPSFVLGARDPHAAVALRAYADSIAADPDCHPDLPASIRRRADEFDAYRLHHGNGDPTRGLHRTDDPETIGQMKKGRSS